MSTMVAELYDASRKAGVEEQLAQRAARAVLGAETRTDLATKTDLIALRTDFGELKTDFAELRADFAELRADVTADLSGMKRELSETKVELIKWNVGAMAILTGIVAAIVRLG
jgi:hypothetical protein